MLREIVVYAGSLLFIVGLLMLTVPIVDIVFSEDVSTYFLAIGLVSIAVGAPIVLASGRIVKKESFVGALIGYSIAWVLVIAVSAIPLSLEIKIPYLDSIFETVSGFTGTGLTVLVGLDNIRKGILFWRALMQWSGELGFAVFAMVVIPYFWRYGVLLYNVERPVKIYGSLQKTARRLLGLYIFYTLVGTVALYYTGAGLFDALTHTMTAIATGGMSNYDKGYMVIYSKAPLTVYPLIAIMFLGGASFISLNDLFEFRFKDLWRNEEFRLYAWFTLILSLLVSALYIFHGFPFSQAFIYGFFNTVSGITTTGFNLGDMGSLPSSMKTLLIAGMFVGGMTFSTAGGLKIGRLLLILKNYAITRWRVLWVNQYTLGSSSAGNQ
ncbi:TrkH family potassium uptake protein [Thermogladius sp. 4427co]|uniref:TrkH family potassium uptake protein n=1 Tax=Thermogladius sp. 4427co TaxID=3450718 RepID=UPI003F7B0F69